MTLTSDVENSKTSLSYVHM